MLKLYEVRNALDSKFYVVACDESEAARMAESAWSSWGYADTGKSTLSVKLLAEDCQYPVRLTAWLLIKGRDDE